jgi:hypothetical protein
LIQYGSRKSFRDPESDLPVQGITKNSTVLALHERQLRKGHKKQQKRSRQDSLGEEGKCLLKRLRTESESSASGKLVSSSEPPPAADKLASGKRTGGGESSEPPPSADKLASGKRTGGGENSEPLSADTLASGPPEADGSIIGKAESKRDRKKRRKEAVRAAAAEMSTADGTAAEELMQVVEADNKPEVAKVMPVPQNDTTSSEKVSIFSFVSFFFVTLHSLVLLRFNL